MHKERILIVDDEQINLDFFEVMLSKLGFEVLRAEDGQEALEVVQSHNPDLIILDNIMPRITGWEVTKTLKTDPQFEQFRDIPIIMFSAMDDVKDKIEGFELGVEDYITKPFNFSEVLARIKAVLRNRELIQQVMKREKRIALIESLNNSLIYFTNHVKNPLNRLKFEASKIGEISPDSIKGFLALVTEEVEEIQATIQGLEEEISELRTKGDQLKEDELSIESLEKKYQKHFKAYKDRIRSDGDSR
ncbi:MAG: response regulator [Spirochaetales bacterium]|nr:response regulator [Spirochaetales bacterium]